MKGLLYKDYINGKGYIVLAGFYIFYIACIIGAVASEFTNATGFEKKIAVLSENYVMFLGCIIVACIMPVGIALGICGLDNKTKWTNYVLALPGGYKVLVTEKYIVALIGEAIAVILSLLVALAIKCFFEVEVDGVQLDAGSQVLYIVMLIMIGSCLIVSAFVLPLTCRNKGRLLDIVATICLVAICYALFAYIALGDISFFQQENFMERILMWIATHKKVIWGIGYGLVGVGIVAQIISYSVTVKMYHKYV